jgi:catechol 2,3-dioxygenase-like lactoylglutathione lyase family enzyme
MSRVQLALRVSNLEASVAFYSGLFGVEPAKRRPGYANFAVAEPPLKLVLLEGQPDQPTVMDHLGVEVETTGEVDAATARLSELGLFTQVENDTTCCYALQDKVWVHGPGAEPWEVYTVKDDSTVYGTDGVLATGAPAATDPAARTEPAACCQPDHPASAVNPTGQSAHCCR